MPNSAHILPGSEHRAARHLRRIGRVPDGEPVIVSVHLAPEITLMVAVPEGPAHSRASLRSARDNAQSQNVAAVRAFAADAGLEVVDADPALRLIRLSGSALAMEAAFGTTLHAYEGDGGTFRGREGHLTIPTDLVDRVIAVLGLDTTPIATAKIVPHRGDTPPAGFLPTDVAKLYDLSDRSAAGQCIGIIELGGGYTDADNKAAFKAMGLPTPQVVAVGVDGATNSPSGGAGADGEVALDIQVAGGIAPGAKLAVYFAPNTSQGFADAILQAVHDEANAPSVLSISWGGPENGWTGQAIAAMSAAFADAAMLGVTVTAASGDALATDGETDGAAHVDYPASDPLVLGCGGTKLEAANSRRAGETVWNSNGGGTGGGVSALFPRPAYQAGLNVPAPPSAKGGRGVPDVAGDADPDTGYRIVAGGKTGLVGGTSAVAPLWAGIVAGLNASRGKPLGDLHASLYAHPSACHDVTRGNNRSGAIGYTAARGWDACTGLGSPNGTALSELFATQTPAPASAAEPRATLFPLAGLDGSEVLIAPGSIFRIRPSISGDEPGATSAEYGSDRLFTNESVNSLLARIGPAERFVKLTARGGTPVWLAADAVSMVREALAPDAPGTEITIGGRRQDVTETVPEVEAALR
jgi:kumamolisin